MSKVTVKSIEHDISIPKKGAAGEAGETFQGTQVLYKNHKNELKEINFPTALLEKAKDMGTVLQKAKAGDTLYFKWIKKGEYMNVVDVSTKPFENAGPSSTGGGRAYGPSDIAGMTATNAVKFAVEVTKNDFTAEKVKKAALFFLDLLLDTKKEALAKLGSTTTQSETPPAKTEVAKTAKEIEAEDTTEDGDCPF